jgi:hypothetical protein
MEESCGEGVATRGRHSDSLACRRQHIVCGTVCGGRLGPTADDRRAKAGMLR